MALTIDVGTFFAGVGTPENKDETGFLLIEDLNYSVSKLFPTFVLMGAGLVGPDSESGIKQKNALFGPMSEIT